MLAKTMAVSRATTKDEAGRCRRLVSLLGLAVAAIVLGWLRLDAADQERRGVLLTIGDAVPAAAPADPSDPKCSGTSSSAVAGGRAVARRLTAGRDPERRYGAAAPYASVSTPYPTADSPRVAFDAEAAVRPRRRDAAPSIHVERSVRVARAPPPPAV